MERDIFLFLVLKNIIKLNKKYYLCEFRNGFEKNLLMRKEQFKCDTKFVNCTIFSLSHQLLHSIARKQIGWRT